MLFKKNKLEQEINENFEAAFKHTSGVKRRLDDLTEAHNNLAVDFYHLSEELATNGVVSDLRKLEKRLNALENGVEGLLGVMNDRFEELDNNGVATAINKLNAEVFGARKSPGMSLLEMFMRNEAGDDNHEVATLAGKVDAIIAHLGLEVEVQPEETKPAEVVAKKKKAVKKKGSR